MLKRHHIVSTLITAVISTLLSGVAPAAAFSPGVGYYNCSGAMLTNAGQPLTARPFGTAHLVINSSVESGVTINSVTGSTLCTDVVIPDEVTKIASFAFDNANVSSFSFPSTLETLENDWLTNQGSLSSIVLRPAAIDPPLPSAHFSVQDNVLFNFDKTKLVLYSDGPASGAPATLRTSYEVPNTVLEIGYGAFYNNKSINSVVLDAHLTTISVAAFSGTTNLANVTLPDSLTSLGIAAFQQSGLTSINIPSGVTEIPQNAFGYTSSLRSVTIDAGSTLSSIGAYAFSDSGITAIVLPQGVTSLGESAFASAASLSSVTFSGGTPGLTVIQQSAFSSTRALASIALPAGLSSIDAYAFYDSGITSIVLPQGVTSLGEFAFASAASLSSVTFSGGTPGLTAIQRGTFESTSALTSIALPAGLLSIGASAFGLSGFSRIDLPATLATLSLDAFKGSNSLTDIHFSGNAPTVAFIYQNRTFGTPTNLCGLFDLEQRHSGLTALSSWEVPTLRNVHLATSSLGFAPGSVGVCGTGQATTWYGLTIGVADANVQITYKGNYSAAPADTIQSVTPGATVITSSVSRNGFTFLGWNTQSDGLGRAIALSATENVSGALTLFAQWRANPVDYSSPPVEKPLISAISMTVFPANEARTITLAGQNLSSVTAILVGGKSLIFTRNLDGGIVLEVPQLTSGFYDLVVSYGLGESITAQNAFTVSAPPSATKVVRFSRFVPDSGKLPVLAASGIPRTLSGYSTIDRVVCTGFTSGVKATAFGRKIALQRAQNACNVAKRLAPKAVIQVRVNVASGVGPKFRRVQLSITGN